MKTFLNKKEEMKKNNLKYLLLSLRSGYQFREQIKNQPNGEFQVLQMKDINQDNSINKEEFFTKINLNLHDESLLLKNDDILFRARGYNNYATVINGLTKKTLVPSYFFILRVNKNIILPEYLAWYINQKTAQQYLKTNSAGTNIPSISKKALEMLEIEIPPLEVQNKIAKVSNLNLRELQILEQIKEKKKLLIETILSKKIINK